MRTAEEYREALSELLVVVFQALDAEQGDDGEPDDLAPHWRDLSDHAMSVLDLVLGQEPEEAPPVLDEFTSGGGQFPKLGPGGRWVLVKDDDD